MSIKKNISLDKKAYDTVLGFLKKIHKTGKIEAMDWNEFRMNLEKVIVQEEQVKAIDLWTMENLEQHHPEMIRPRVLHEFESTFISPKSHGLFMEALHYGMVSQSQGEMIIDELLDSDALGLLPDTMEISLAKTWKKNTAIYNKVRLN